MLWPFRGIWHDAIWGIRKALILDGETRSKVYSPKDRRSAFLFGDGGVAALVERDEKFGKSYFSLNSDGSRADLIMIKGGGYRHPSSEETLREKVVDEYGNIRSDEQGYMQGGDVFNFVIREIPRDIKRHWNMWVILRTHLIISCFIKRIILSMLISLRK